MLAVITFAAITIVLPPAAPGISPCLRLQFRSWTPDIPGWLPASWFTTPPPLRLLDSRPPAPYRPREGRWLAVGPAPESGPDTTWSYHEGSATVVIRMADYLSAWRRPVPDSLEIRRVAAVSFQISIGGRFVGDTLWAQTVVSSDAGLRSTAMVVGVQYSCSDRRAATAAAAAVARLSAR